VIFAARYTAPISSQPTGWCWPPVAVAPPHAVGGVLRHSSAA